MPTLVAEVFQVLAVATVPTTDSTVSVTTPGGSGNATYIQGRAVSADAPTDGQALVWDDGAQEWVPGDSSSVADFADLTGRWALTQVDNTGAAGTWLNADQTWRAITYDDIAPAASTTIAKTGGTALLEIGATNTTPAFTSAPSATPSSSIVTDSDGNTPQDVTSTPTAWTSLYSYTKTTNAQFVTWTKTDIIGGLTKTATVTQFWGTRVYYGASSSVGGPFDEAYIEALATSVLGTSRARSVTYTLAAGERFVMAFPVSFGTPVFTVGGFLVSPDVLGSAVGTTNLFSLSVPYNVYAVSNFAVGASSATVVVT